MKSFKNVKIRLHRQNQHSYAIITHDTVELSVKLEQGMTAGASLRKYVHDAYMKANRLKRQADLVDFAQELL